MCVAGLLLFYATQSSSARNCSMLQQPSHKRIQRLVGTVAAQVRSPQVIHSLSQALEELVANSVDAKASVIDIEIDAVSLGMRVSDDGCGISQLSFPSLATRHASSKPTATASDHSSYTLGYKGEALASLAEVSVLQITSKAAGAFETYEKLLRGGKLVKQGLATDQKQKTGTTVWMQNFLFNQPVRRRLLEPSGYAAGNFLYI